MTGILDTIRSLFEMNPPEAAPPKDQAPATSAGDQASPSGVPGEKTVQQSEAPDLGSILDSVGSFLGSNGEEE